PVSNSPCDYRWALSLTRHRWNENLDIVKTNPTGTPTEVVSWGSIDALLRLWNRDDEDGLEVRIDREAGAGAFGCLGLGLDRPACQPVVFGHSCDVFCSFVDRYAAF